MNKTETKKERYVVLSVPTDDGAFWFVYDSVNRTAKEVASHEEAVRVARAANDGVLRFCDGNVIEYRGAQQLDSGAVIASVYINGRFQFDTLKSVKDALAAAESLCDLL